MKIAMIGLGSWGTALSVRLGARHQIKGWTHDPAQRNALREDTENRKYLPGVPLPKSLTVVDAVQTALEDAELIVLAVPSFAVREIARSLHPSMPTELFFPDLGDLAQAAGPSCSIPT